MEIYRNLNGDSNVDAFEIGADFIIVHFRTGTHKTYTYTYGSTGQDDVEQMKLLARQGHGLNGYIGRHIRTRYASKAP